MSLNHAKSTQPARTEMASQCWPPISSLLTYHDTLYVDKIKYCLLGMTEVSPSFKKKKKNYQSVMKKSQLNQKNK